MSLEDGVPTVQLKRTSETMLPAVSNTLDAYPGIKPPKLFKNEFWIYREFYDVYTDTKTKELSIELAHEIHAKLIEHLSKPYTLRVAYRKHKIISGKKVNRYWLILKFASNNDVMMAKMLGYEFV